MASTPYHFWDQKPKSGKGLTTSILKRKCRSGMYRERQAESMGQHLRMSAPKVHIFDRHTWKVPLERRN